MNSHAVTKNITSRISLARMLSESAKTLASRRVKNQLLKEMFEKIRELHWQKRQISKQRSRNFGCY